MAVLALGITSWSSVRCWKALHIPTASHNAVLVPLCLTVLGAWYSLRLLRSVCFELRARSLGCSHAPVHRPRDPFLGLDQLAEMARAQQHDELLQLWAHRHERYGRTHWFSTLGGWVLLTDEPENLKTILATNMDDWPIAGPRLYAARAVVGVKSIFANNGRAWREARAMLRPSFVRDQVADLQCLDRHIEHLIARIPTDGGAVDMQQLLFDLSMDSSSDFILGHSTDLLTNPSPEARQWARDFEYASYESSRRARMGIDPLLLPHSELRASVRRLREFVRYYLRAAAAAAGVKPQERSYVFLHELLRSGADEQYVIDQILSIFIAGRDTTANAMTTVFWYLSRSPGAVAKLRAEIAGVGADNPTWEQLRGMKYTHSIIKEALRLCPPVSTNSRTARKDTVLPRGGGPDGQQPVLVPKGTPVRWSLYSVHRRRDIYGPDAEEFRPERWESDLRGIGWEYLPFHGGPRICIGQQFALTEMAYTLYRIFQRFRAVESKDSRPLRLHAGVTTSYAYGCLVGFTPA